VCDSGKTVSPFPSKGQEREGERERGRERLGLNHGQTNVIEAEGCEREIILILCSADNFTFFYVRVVEVI